MNFHIRVALIFLAAVILLAGCGGGAAVETPSDNLSVSPGGGFVFRLPDGVTDGAGEDSRCGDAFVCWVADDFTLMVAELAVGDATDVAGYVNLILPDMMEGTPGIELLSQKETTTASGLPSVQLELSRQEGLVRVFEQDTLAGGRLLRLYFSGLSDGFDEAVRPIAEETFLSVEVHDALD